MRRLSILRHGLCLAPIQRTRRQLEGVPNEPFFPPKEVERIQKPL